MTETCSVCQGEFSPEDEGGSIGEIGILRVSFCPTCLSGIMDLMEKRVCPQCEFYDGPEK